MKRCLWREPQWQKIVWTDENVVRTWTKDGRLRIWINPKDKIGTNMFNRLEQGNCGGFLVWAAIWMNGRSEIKIMNGESQKKFFFIIFKVLKYLY